MFNNEDNQIINVLDSMMGQGKSTWLINNINRLMSLIFEGKPVPKIIVITPYLGEIDRYKSECPGACFVSPEKRGKGKKDDLNKLIKAGENIVATHSLWKIIDRQTYQLLNQHSYKLFIDEAFECVDFYKGITLQDFKMLLEQEYIEIAEDDRIVWKESPNTPYRGKFDQFKSLAINGNLYHWKNKNYWMFPVDIFNCFNEIWVLTYLWKGSLMAAYISTAGYRVHHHGLVDHELVPHALCYESNLKAEYAEMITIVSAPKMNAIGNMSKYGSNKSKYTLSSGWYGRQDNSMLKTIKNNAYNFFNNIVAKKEANAAMWTCYKDQKSKLKGSGYTKGFVPCNARATNEYRHKRNLAYLINLYLNPTIATFIESRGYKADSDQFALSSLLQ